MIGPTFSTNGATEMGTLALAAGPVAFFDQYSSLIFTVGVLIGIYTLLAMGLNMHWGETGLMNLAHAAFFGVGAYTTTILTTAPRGGSLFDRTVGFDLPIVVGILAAMAFTGFLGVLIATTSLRVEDDYLAVVTLGLSLILELVVGGESWLTGGVQGISSIPRPLADVVGTDSYNLFYFVVVWVLVGVVYLAFRRLQKSPFGRVLWSIREDEQVPKALGKRTFLFKLKAFGLGAAVAGLGGALWAHFSRAIAPALLEPNLTFLILTAIIVGGAGSYLGAVVGTVTLLSLYQAVEYIQFSGPVGDKLPFLRLILIGSLLILVMYFRPYGLLGNAERKSAGGHGE